MKAAKFHLLGGPPVEKTPSTSDSEADDQLVVDETPKKKSGNTSKTALKPGSLKLKLSGILYICIYYTSVPEF